MKEIETRVRAIKQDGLVWGACKYQILSLYHIYKLSHIVIMKLIV